MRFPGTFLLLMVLAACQQAEAPVASTRGLTAQQFVDLYVGLRELRGSAPDSATYEQQKLEFFRKNGATPESMQQFVEDNAANLTLMSAVWDSVQTRITRAGPGEH